MVYRECLISYPVAKSSKVLLDRYKLSTQILRACLIISNYVGKPNYYKDKAAVTFSLFILYCMSSIKDGIVVLLL